MKKMRIAGLLLALPLTLLCACGGSSKLQLSSNWYEDTSINSVSGTETLTYNVTFEAPSTPSAFGVVYEGGTYVTKLGGGLETVDGGTESVYVYETTLNISGYFYYNDEKASFADVVTTSVTFRRADLGLTPIKSSANMQTTYLANANPSNLAETYRQSHVLRETSYDLTNKKATVSTTDLKAETPTPTTKEIEIPDATFFDNEQILFALRSVPLASAVGFYSIDPQTNTAEGVTTYEPEAATYSLVGVKINGTVSTDESVQAHVMTLRYNKTMTGSGRKLWYAQTVATKQNTYRNVLLRMETTLYYSMGKLCYQLAEANFA